ncbi:MAG: 50S ribosomal protein L24 [Candidatus Oxydemutatoraceae bacterium WSBS_2016_MAG_OTU14]
MARKIKKNDEVIVTIGKSKGTKGKVLTITDEHVTVEGANLQKKTFRPNPDKGEAGGIREQEAIIHISNVQIVNPKTGKADRIGFRVLEDGRKVRYLKSDNETLD